MKTTGENFYMSVSSAAGVQRHTLTGNPTKAWQQLAPNEFILHDRTARKPTGSIGAQQVVVENRKTTFEVNRSTLNRRAQHFAQIGQTTPLLFDIEETYLRVIPKETVD
ncbi:hypothetical protein DPMN_185493 [Dreissena polymorpha]|uniref:Uncharacterized protein n=1 Tax=Dreissena polymorpha TaxID=45954 RepID=A0A9D4I8F6_DREPO|nr:hypothetical protein DPMN_185493 [Dreissena polymorpha]